MHYDRLVECCFDRIVYSEELSFILCIYALG